MKRIILSVTVLVCVVLLSSVAMAAPPYASTPTKASSGTSTTTAAAKQKDIILTTEDIKDSYKVIGIISARGGEIDLDALNNKLKDAARQIGADYVIGINYFNYSGYVYAYGTAVKIKQ